MPIYSPPEYSRCWQLILRRFAALSLLVSCVLSAVASVQLSDDRSQPLSDKLAADTASAVVGRIRGSEDGAGQDASVTPLGQIAFIRGEDTLCIVDPDGRNLRKLADDVKRHPHGPVMISWSPDGSNLLFHRTSYNINNGEGKADIWSIDPEGKKPRNLTSQLRGDYLHPQYSPDGSRIVCGSYDPNDPKPGLFVIDIESKKSTKISDRRYMKLARWSPDGKRVAFHIWHRPEETRFIEEIYVVDADGKNEKKLTQGSDLTWSPDGKRILFVGRGNGGIDVCVCDADGKNEVNLTNTPEVMEEDPLWSPDGKRIVYRVSGEPDQLEIIDVNGKNRRRLASTVPLRIPSWSPDGKWLSFTMFSDRMQRTNICVIDADGNNLRKIAENAQDPAWRPAATVQK